MDKEKVIKGLECCLDIGTDHCDECPYSNDCICNSKDIEEGLLADALALLKKQEPLEPITDESLHVHVFRCRKCNRILQRNNEMDYCPKCGQPIKWQ